VHRRSPARRAQRVQAAPGRDLEQPDTQRRAALEPGQALPGREQRLLQRVLRVVGRAEDPVAVHLQLTPVGADEFAERLLVAHPRPVYQLRAHHTHHLTTLALWFSRGSYQYRHHPGRKLGGADAANSGPRPVSTSLTARNLRTVRSKL
jgi:hypothetical protein